MATFPDLATLDHGTAAEAKANVLTLPIRGHEYTWRPSDLTLRAVLTLQRLDEQTREIVTKAARGEAVDETETVLTDAEEEQLADDLIGAENRARMTDDGVKWRELQHVLAVLIAWYLQGEASARRVWERRPRT
jgi:hypothetical protein